MNDVGGNGQNEDNNLENKALAVDMPERRELFKKAAMTAVGLAVGGSAGAVMGVLAGGAQAQTVDTTLDCNLTASELQFANTVDRIFNDPNFVSELQTSPDIALQSAGYTLTSDQLQALQAANYNLAPTSDVYMAVPLVRPVVRVITRGTKPVVTIITRGTQPVVQVVVNTVVTVSPPDPVPTPSPSPTPSPAPTASPTPIASTTAS